MKTFEQYNKLRDIVNQFIDEAIIKSEKFGLKIRKEDILIEKSIVYDVFSKYNSQIEKMKWNEYEILQRKILLEIYNKLDEQIKYYFENSKKNEVRNKYNCHIEDVITNLFRYLDMNKNK